jgi:type 1 fimbria pilin
MRPTILSTSNASGGTKNSGVAVLDYYGRPEVSLQVVVTGSATWTVQQSLDNPLTDGVTPTWFSHPDPNMVAQTINRQGNYAYIPVAVRLQQTAGTGSAILTIVQAGLHP